MSKELSCYDICNSKYGAMDPKRIYCKKGCDSDENNLVNCKNETCTKLCIKSELGDGETKLGGCNNKKDDDD